jgi:hypothetical protein
MISITALADDGSCGNFDTVTAVEINICVDLGKGPTSRDAKIARSLIESGRFLVSPWPGRHLPDERDRPGHPRRQLSERAGILHGQRSPGSSCVRRAAKYATDVARCGLQYLKK